MYLLNLGMRLRKYEATKDIKKTTIVIVIVAIIGLNVKVLIPNRLSNCSIIRA